MNIKEAIIVTVIFIALSVFGFVLTFDTFSNQGIRDIAFNSLEGESIITSELETCTEVATIDLEGASDPTLRKLADYQTTCQSFVAEELMIFAQMPPNEERAEILGNIVAGRLQEFAQYGVKPLVIIEPADGVTQLSFSDFNDGVYTPYLEKYFDTIKAAGITDQQMGTWVPFPEANVPYWNHGEALPEDFGENVNIFMKTMKDRFPEAEGSILLNSVTYDPEDSEWANGYYTSLVPYIRTIDPQYIDSVGIQGFPWVSRTNPDQPRVEIFETQRFLGMDFALEAAAFMRKNEIWVNTGSFSARYTNDPEGLARVGISKRKTILNDIIDEVLRARDDLSEIRDIRVKINLFAEDKSNTAEATDWSYINTQEGEILFREFVTRLEAERIPLSLFDTASQ